MGQAHAYSTRMIPFHADALLPDAERYASLKFRRVHHGEWDVYDETELAAFLYVVPIRWARWIFQWDRGIARRAVRVTGNPEFALANSGALDVETGVAVIRAMRDGGWRHGTLPNVSRDALRELHHNGLNDTALAEMTGLSVDQVQYARKGRPRGDLNRFVSVASLAIG